MATSSLRIPICESQVACDGASVRPPRAICGSCERKLEKKAKGTQAQLRGERTFTTGSEWRKAQRKAKAIT